MQSSDLSLKTRITQTQSSITQEMEHIRMVERRAAQDATAPEGLKSSQGVLEDTQLPLEQKKRKILRNLRTLEQAGFVSSTNKYQEFINDISKVEHCYKLVDVPALNGVSGFLSEILPLVDLL